MLSNIDERILNLLSVNARLSYRQIAKKLKISVATVMSHVQRLEKDRIIKGYSVNIDHDRIGYDIAVIIELRISKGKLFEMEKKIASHPSVYAVYDHTGAFDATLIAKFRNRRKMDDFLKLIQGFEFVERTETKLILNIIKEESIRLCAQ